MSQSDDLHEGDFEDNQDWPSSDIALSELEQRMTRWHNSLPTVQKGTCVIPLHRYQFEEENRPKPGNKVYVKLRSRPKNVSFIAFPNDNTNLSSPNAFVKANTSLARDYLTSLPHVENDKASDIMSDTAEHLALHRPNSTRSEPSESGIFKQKKRKQYTAAEYQALKAELRRKQKSWLPLMPNRAATVL